MNLMAGPSPDVDGGHESFRDPLFPLSLISIWFSGCYRHFEREILPGMIRVVWVRQTGVTLPHPRDITGHRTSLSPCITGCV